MRDYIRSHPDYKFDSVVSSRIATDLMAKCHRMGQGLELPPELYGDFPIHAVSAKDATSARLLSIPPREKATSLVEKTMERYAQRTELMARKRALVGDLEEHRARLQKTEASLGAIEQQLSGLDSSPRLSTPR